MATIQLRDNSGVNAPTSGASSLEGTIVPAITGLVVLCLLITPLFDTAHVYDEGFALVNAVRLGDGEVPYRDFWTVYTPGEYYVVAGLFHVFGREIVVARIFDILVQALLCWQTYTLLRPRTGARTAGLVTALAALLIAACAQHLYPLLTCMVLSLVALRLVIAATSGGGRRHTLAVAGVLITLSGWFRQDEGVYGVVMVMVVVAMARVTQRRAERSAPLLPTLARDAGAFVGGALLSFLLVFCPWAVRVPLHTLVDQLVGFPVGVLHEARHLPLPSLVPNLHAATELGAAQVLTEWFLFYVVIGLALTGTILAVLRRHALTGAETARADELLRTGFLALTLLHVAQMVGRFDFQHALPSVLYALLLGAVGWSVVFGRGRPMGVRLLGWLSACLVISGLAGLPSLQVIRLLSVSPPWSCAASLEHARCVRLPTDEARAVELIRAHTSPSDPLFVGTTSHDTVFVNDALFYYLADRRPATRYHEYSPLVTDTESVQSEMVGELEAERPPWIVLYDAPRSDEDNASSVSTGVVILDDWIRANYLQDATVGSYQLWRARTG